jgi:hypothetical protein
MSYSGRGVAMTRETRERERRLADALIDLYVSWREECSAVELAYERWREAAKEDRETAFVAYNLALDREERASNVYAARIRQATCPIPLPV